MSIANEFLPVILVIASASLLLALLVQILHSRNTMARLVHYAPSVADGTELQKGPSRPESMFRGLLKLIDPTFESAEKHLQALGVDKTSLVLWVVCAKGAVAIVCAGTGAVVLLHNQTGPFVIWPVTAGLFIGVLLGSNALLHSLSRQRRQRLGGELCFGIDLLTIFLESGQSLDQALRSFCEVCSRATPLLLGPQRRLVADLDNGVAYEKALDTWAKNLAISYADSLASLFVQSLLHGSELGPQLRRFSADLAERRVLAARESIGSKSARLTVVMVVFFLPAIIAFVAAPPIVGVLKHFEVTE